MASSYEVIERGKEAIWLLKNLGLSEASVKSVQGLLDHIETLEHALRIAVIDLKDDNGGVGDPDDIITNWIERAVKAEETQDAR